MIASIFDKCVGDLEVNGGYALLPLSELQSSSSDNVVFNAFQTARRALDKMEHDDFISRIDPSTDSGGWTGYHKADSINGRYNHYREGIVFSNNEYPRTMNSNIDFQSDMKQFFHFCHDTIANGILRAIERRLELPDCYFDNELGPTGDASQWHMKRYQLDVTDASKADNESTVLLPMHTDPSLISVVIVDGIGINEGGKGLQVLYPKNAGLIIGSNDDNNKSNGTWKSISHHGHDVAIIFVGSVLSYLTKGQVFSAIKHRVVHDYVEDTNKRMAATLFVRPNPDCVMRILPSKYIKHECPSSGKLPPTFRVWNARVAKNYMKRGRKNEPQKSST